MTLTPGQWAAIDAIIATHCPNTALIAAVENELRKARHDSAQHASNGGDTDASSVQTDTRL